MSDAKKLASEILERTCWFNLGALAGFLSPLPLGALGKSQRMDELVLNTAPGL